MSKIEAWPLSPAGIKVEGIYRVSSSVSSINRLKVAFDTGELNHGIT